MPQSTKCLIQANVADFLFDFQAWLLLLLDTFFFLVGHPTIVTLTKFRVTKSNGFLGLLQSKSSTRLGTNKLL